MANDMIERGNHGEGRVLSPEKIAEKANKKVWDKERDRTAVLVLDRSGSMQDRYQAYGDWRSANAAGNTEMQPEMPPMTKEKLSFEEFAKWDRAEEARNRDIQTTLADEAATDRFQAVAKAEALKMQLNEAEATPRVTVPRRARAEAGIWEA